MRSAVASLPRVQRIALTLAKLQDLSLAEATLRLRLGTVPAEA